MTVPGRALVASGLRRLAAGAWLLAASPAFASPPAPLPSRAESPDCEWRWAWGALLILERRSETVGALAAATAQAESTLRMVEWAGDTVRQGIVLATLSKLAEERGDHDTADRL